MERNTKSCPIYLLNTYLRYFPGTGRLVYKRGNGRRSWAGKTACRPDPQGHLVVSMNDTQYCAHRVIWAMVHGEWPDADVIHLNGHKADNRLENLALAPPRSKDHVPDGPTTTLLPSAT